MREVIVKLSNPDDVQHIIDYAHKNLNAVAYECYTADNGVTMTMSEVREYYNDSFLSHPHTETLLARDYTLVPWDELDYDDQIMFADMITFVQCDGYLNIDLITHETLDEFIESHQNWIVPPSLPETTIKI